MSWLMPTAPRAWIARSITHSAILGVRILMAWMPVWMPHRQAPQASANGSLKWTSHTESS